MTTLIPRSRNRATAAFEVGRRASATAKRASVRPPSASATTVFPACCQRRTTASSCKPSQTGEPRRSVRPSTTPSTPIPATALNPLTAPRTASPCAATMARASGCSELCSRAAAKCSASAEVRPRTSVSVTCGWPQVSVPVLSRASTVSFSARSSASAFLTRMPARAPWPVPTMIAVGVASPSAHGQAMTSTATALTSASEKSPA